MRSLPDTAPNRSTPGGGVKVLYITGWGRSGSTILDNLLGELPGFFSAGELTYLWERGLVERRRCGCGEPLLQCSVWSQVLTEAFGDALVDGVDPQAVMRWQRQSLRVRHTWRLLRKPPGGITGDEALDAYTSVMGRVYRALAKVTGARIIVDSSKRPSDGAQLRLIPGVVPFYVHLVRDPRAVAYSWGRRKKQLDRDRPAELKQHSRTSSTVSWVGWNLAAEALRRRHPGDQSLLVRYEDFVTRPRATLAAIAGLVGERPAEFPIEGERTARLGPNHTVSGNPSRFSTGKIDLREDMEWVAEQRAADRLAVTALSLPLLRRYSYELLPKARKGA